MSAIPRLLDTQTTDPRPIDQAKLRACIDACNAAAQACTSCADIRTTTARVLARQASYDASLTRALLLACITAGLGTSATTPASTSTTDAATASTPAASPSRPAVNSSTSLD